MTKVGVTGHQRLDDSEAWSWVKTAIKAELDLIACPILALSSLAIGADQLLACLVLNRGGALHAAIPFADYERTFAAEDVKKYRRILLKAESVKILDPQNSDEDAYLAAGMQIVDDADVMIAVWNGLPAKGKGGTADIVSYASAKRVPVIHINPLDRTVTRR